ncbi:hypothetical protein L1887_17667 [Cichorium endivia]|nr:hypothetical protein L1887_17667 [Cichorium endivia]
MLTEKILDTFDAVLDVGGVFDPRTDRFDHHQKGFNEILSNGFTTKLSSAGLVYKLDEGHPDVQILFSAVYKNFVEEQIQPIKIIKASISC